MLFEFLSDLHKKISGVPVIHRQTNFHCELAHLKVTRVDRENARQVKQWIREVAMHFYKTSFRSHVSMGSMAVTQIPISSLKVHDIKYAASLLEKQTLPFLHKSANQMGVWQWLWPGHHSQILLGLGTGT